MTKQMRLSSYLLYGGLLGAILKKKNTVEPCYYSHQQAQNFDRINNGFLQEDV